MTARKHTEGGLEQMPQIDNPDLEAVRWIAWELLMENMHFHELAMAEPFKAESYVQDAGRRLAALVGYPKGWKVYVPAGGQDKR